MKTQAEPIIRQRLNDYVRLLKEEFASQGLILPTKADVTVSSSSVDKKINVPLSTHTQLLPSTLSAVKSPSIPGVGPMETRDLVIEDTFKCTRQELFQTFTDINMVKAFTQNSAIIYDCKQGGQFSLFGNNITGHFLEIVPYDSIEMMWRFKSWPEEHYSLVKLEFIDDNDQTKLIVRQSGVPAQYYDNTWDGWRRFYLESIKKTFGYGARLL